MCYTFLKFSDFARVCNRLGQRLCFETSQGFRSPIPLRSGSPPPPPRWGGEDIMRGVVRAAHQTHFTGGVEQ